MCGLRLSPRPIWPRSPSRSTDPSSTALADVRPAATGATVVAGTFEPVPDERRVYNTLVVVGPGRPARPPTARSTSTTRSGWCESERVQAGRARCRPTRRSWRWGSSASASSPVTTCGSPSRPGRRSTPGRPCSPSRPPGWPARTRSTTGGPCSRPGRSRTPPTSVAAAQPGPTYTGHSRVVDPFGVVLARARRRRGAEPIGRW